jgi:hypothetical protein
MYDLINTYSERVLELISQEQGYIEEYEHLAREIGDARSAAYRAQYVKFWAMGAARLSEKFKDVYFDMLKSSAVPTQELEEVVRVLYDASANSKGRHSIQFSFATKLMHMKNRRLPIYDSQVAAFYFFQPPRTGRDQSERIARFMSFYQFLVFEYRRILDQNLLARPIEAFRNRFAPTYFTDEKIIDSLIWAFVGLLNKDAVWRNQITYG